MADNNSRQFTIDNWGYPPQNRRSFQQVQALFPTTRLGRGPGPITPFDRGFKEIIDIPYKSADGSDQTVQQML